MPAKNKEQRRNRNLTAKRLREQLTYDGHVFRWRRARPGIHANQIAAPNYPDIVIDYSLYAKRLLVKLYEMPDETPFVSLLQKYGSRPKGQHAPKVKRPRRNTQLEFDLPPTVETTA